MENLRSKKNVLLKNHVQVTGNQGGAPTMIFGHGFGTDQNAWAEVSKPFLGRFRVVLYDNVGAGQSAEEEFSPDIYCNLQAYAQDLLNICEELQLRNAIMVAHSVSGMISLLAALKKPEYFSRIILVGASPRYLNAPGYKGGFEAADLEQMFRMMENNYYAWASGFAPMVMQNPDRPHLSENFADGLMSIRPDVALAVTRTIMQSDHRHILNRVQHPTLIVQTKDDIAVPLEVAEFMHRSIPGSRLKVVNATGHLPHLSAPGEIIAAIEEFISVPR